jgi:hypothetical protein
MIFSNVKTFKAELESIRVQQRRHQPTFEQHPPKMSPTVLSDARKIEAMVECTMALCDELLVVDYLVKRFGE